MLCFFKACATHGATGGRGLMDCETIGHRAGDEPRSSVLAPTAHRTVHHVMLVDNSAQFVEIKANDSNPVTKDAIHIHGAMIAVAHF
jgi:hypothetical protein